MTLKDYITTFLSDNTIIKVTLPIDINDVIYELPVAQNISVEAFKSTEIYSWDLDVESTKGYANQLNIVLETQSLEIDIIPESIPDTEPSPESNSDSETENDPYPEL